MSDSQDSQLELQDDDPSDVESLDESLWFSSDMVILRAQSTTFEVLAAILKAQSSVFADMFFMPQPPSMDVETFEGVPVIDLHDDPHELDAFLRAIFYSNFFMPPPSVSGFSHTIGILRLSHKYDVPYLRRRALQHLDAVYATDLKGYDARGQKRNAFSSSDDPGNCIATIRAATEVGALWLLPGAYNDLSKRTVADLLSLSSWNLLEEEERRIALVGHSVRLQAFHGIVKFLITLTASDDCEDPDECCKLREDFTDEIRWENMLWPLEEYMKRSLWAKWEEAGICEDCIEDAKREHAEARAAFWNRLPQMFGLGFAEADP